jgi:hypothetical protein
MLMSTRQGALIDECILVVHAKTRIMLFEALCMRRMCHRCVTRLPLHRAGRFEAHPYTYTAHLPNQAMNRLLFIASIS